MTDAVDVLNATSNTRYRAAFLPGWGISKDFGRCDFDINKVVHVSGIYELPIGRGKTFLHDSGRAVNAILGGWVTNWILTLQDGQPGTVPCATSTTSGFGCFADKVAGQNPDAGPHNVNQWLNPAAFATPPVATTIGQSRLQSARRRSRAISLGRDSTGWTFRCSRCSNFRRGSVWSSVRSSSISRTIRTSRIQDSAATA